LITPPFAGGVAPFEEDHYLELSLQNPVLKLHEFALQLQQLPEIEAAIDGFLLGAIGDMVQKARQPVVVDFQFEFLVDAVDQLVMNTV
jgi:hypothetical protein